MIILEFLPCQTVCHHRQHVQQHLLTAGWLLRVPELELRGRGGGGKGGPGRRLSIHSSVDVLRQCGRHGAGCWGSRAAKRHEVTQREPGVFVMERPP